MTTFKKTALIYNPNAGRFKRGGGALIAEAVDILKRNGHCLELAPTTGPGTAGAIAWQRIEDGADLIIAAGGDGTINETAEGVIGTQAALAALPGGTANVLATELKLGRNLLDAARALESWVPRRISVGHITCSGGAVSRYFLLMAGVGLDAQVVFNVNPALKARLGKFAYWVAGWSLVGKRLPEFQVSLDGERPVSCGFALLTKVRNYGGDFEIARNVQLHECDFEAVLFEGSSTLRYVKYFAGMAVRRLDGMGGISMLRTPGGAFSVAPGAAVHVQVDGEYAGMLPAQIRIVPDALTLLGPQY